MERDGERGNRRLAGKVAIVTGGARGIGRAIVEQFIGEGANVMACDVKADALEALQRDLAHHEHQLLIQTTDVRKSEDIDRSIQAVNDHWGAIDILVNNAGVNAPKNLEEISEEEWDWVLDVNLKGPFLFIKSIVPHMKRGNGGIIINIVSPAGKTGGAVVRSAHYNSSKGGLVTLTKSAARELAGYHIRVNGISPGQIRTEMTSSMNTKLQQELFSLIPLKRLGQPEDVARAAVFLCSDEAGYITGQILPVNGGLWMMY